MKNELFFSASALSLAGMAGAGETNVVVGGNEWRLSPECRIDGSILTVTVPKDKAGGLHAATTVVDLEPFENEGFEAVIRVQSGR